METFVRSVGSAPVWVGLGLGVAVTLAQGQAAPDAGSLLRETQRDAAPPATRPAPAASPLATPAAPSGRSGPQFIVDAFVIDGATLVPESELQAALAPWRGRRIGFDDLERAAQAVVDAYARRGWLARAHWPAQEISAGRVSLRVVEARLGALRLTEPERATRVAPGYATELLTARQAPGEPLRLAAIDRAINLLNDTPGVAASVALAPGRSEGESDLLVTLRDRPAWAAALQLDSFGARSTGAARVSANVALDDPSGRGDQLTLGSAVSTGSRYLRLGYTIAAGGDGLRLGAGVSAMTYRLQREFAALEARGEAQTLNLVANYPVVRSAARNLFASATLEAREYRDKASGVQTARKTAHVATLAFNGDLSDAAGEGGYLLWSAALAAGRIDLAGEPANAAADAAGPRTAGGFGKLNASLARLQPLGPRTALWASLSGQLATRNLDSSEQFALGGAYGVRAYPALEAQGDSGWLATLELRHTLAPQWQAIAFADVGGVQRRHDNDHAGAPAPNHVTLKGAGLGLTWSRPGAFSVRAIVAGRLSHNPAANPATGADADGSRRTTRFWLVATQFF